MSNRLIVVLKVLVHIACLAPVAWLIVHLIQNNLGPDPTAAVTFFTGRGTLRLLVISLAITPVRKLITPLSPSFNSIIRFRRMLGLYAFFYACLHLLTYIWLYADFSLVRHDRRHHQTPLHHCWTDRLGAHASTGAHLHHVVDPQAWRQELEPPAPACLSLRNRRESFITGGESSPESPPLPTSPSFSSSCSLPGLS